MANWQFYVRREFNYFIEWVQVVSTAKEHQEKYYNFSFPLNNYLILNGDEFYWEDNAAEYHNFLEENYKKDKKFFDKLIKTELQLAKDAQKMANLLVREKANFSSYSQQELLYIYKKFLNSYLGCFGTAFIRPDEYLEEKARKIIDKHSSEYRVKVDKKFLESLFHYPSRCARHLDYLEEPFHILLIAQEIKNKGESVNNLSPQLKDKVKRHWLKYQWLKSPIGYENVQLTKEEILGRIEFLLKEKIREKIKYILNHRIKIEKGFRQTVKILKIKGADLEILNYLREFIFLRTYTTESVDQLFYWARQTILREIAKRAEIKDEEIVALTGKEIIEFLEENKKVPLDIIKERRKNFAVEWKNGRGKIYFGKRAQKIINKHKKVISFYNGKRLDWITGQVACRGKAIGQVRVLKNHRQAEKMAKGEILVVSMTTPDYISAMEKAAAFITDEGGITCHAAIIAREMKKPCIIGTKIATKVLKDGDVVDVDGNTGTINVISSK